RSVSQLVNDLLEKSNIECDSICGVPYTALPVASVISVEYNRPMLIRRKEAKSYGTKKMIEGIYKNNDQCLIIEDIVTTGSSVIETAQSLREHGLRVNNAIVFLDREQNGKNNLEANGITLHG
ncbi:unnamed protein product, partial [Didymodactylos carnosus]